MPTPSETLVRRFAEAVSRGEAEDAVRECHPEVRFFSALASLEGRPVAGHDGIRDYFENVRSAFDEWRVELDEVREAPDGRVAVAMTMHVRGKESGVFVQQRVGHVWRVRDEGVAPIASGQQKAEPAYLRELSRQMQALLDLPRP